MNKLDMARYLSAWNQLPHRVCLGGQKNFQFFMQRLKDDPPSALDSSWFKRLACLAVLYRSAEKTVRGLKFPAYGAQIVAYLIAGLSLRTNGQFN